MFISLQSSTIFLYPKESALHNGDKYLITKQLVIIFSTELLIYFTKINICCHYNHRSPKDN